VLIETPAVLQALGEDHGFLDTVPVQKVEDHKEIDEALKKSKFTPGFQDIFVSDGHDRCVPTIYELSEMYGAWPAKDSEGFRPLDKSQQHSLLRGRPSNIPNVDVDLTPESLKDGVSKIGFPLMLKAKDGTAGHGTCLANNQEELNAKVDEIRGLKNFGQLEFSGFLLEKYIPHDGGNTEFSLQGLVDHGKVLIRSVSEQVTNLDETGTFETLYHVAYAPNKDKHVDLVNTGRGDVETLGQKTNAFHMDMMKTNDANYNIEMGSRLGGSYLANDAVNKYTLAEETLRVALGLPLLSRSPSTASMAGYALLTEPQCSHILEAAQEHDINTCQIIPHVIRREDESGGNVARVVLKDNDPQKLHDVLMKTKNPAARTEVEAALVTEYQSTENMNASPQADERTQLLRNVQSQRGQTRWDWTAAVKKAKEVGTTLVKTASSCCR
jgi:ATP-grasp domain